MPVNDDVLHLSTQQMLLILLVLTLWVILITVTMIAVLKAATLPPPIALVVAMTSLTLVSIAAYVLTRADQLSTLAGMGMGALAGAVAALWQRPREPGSGPPGEDEVTYTVGNPNPPVHPPDPDP